MIVSPVFIVVEKDQSGKNQLNVLLNSSGDCLVFVLNSLLKEQRIFRTDTGFVVIAADDLARRSKASIDTLVAHCALEEKDGKFVDFFTMVNNGKLHNAYIYEYRN